MLKWINKQGVESDEGFVVQFTGRFTAEYREAGRVLKLFVDAGPIIDGRPSELVDPSAFDRWESPDTDVAISESEKNRIIRNVCEAFEFQGLRIVVDGNRTSIDEIRKRFPSLE